MASEMQERIAQALHKSMGGRVEWDRLPELSRALHRGDALAAMEAMREPTQVMVRAYIEADPRRRRFAATAKRDLGAAIAAEIEAAKQP